jgi:hypothetical protein
MKKSYEYPVDEEQILQYYRIEGDIIDWHGKPE